MIRSPKASGSHRVQRPARALFAGLLALVTVLVATLARADRVIVLVDNSGSMRSNDAERLVPQAVLRFASGLGPETELAIVAFDESARLLTPLGAPDAVTPAVLERLDYRGQFTDPANAIERALYELQDKRPATPGDDSIIVLTDGVVDLGSRAASLRAEDWLLGDLRAALVERNVTVWAVALTELADYRLLSQLTKSTGGRYFRALSAADVSEVVDRIGAGMARRSGPGDASPSPATTAAAPSAVAREGGPDAMSETREASATAVPETRVPETRVPETGDESELAAAPAPGAEAERTSTVSAAPAQRQETARPAETGSSRLRWWLAFAFLAIGIGLLGWVALSTWRDRRRQDGDAEQAHEYFPDCTLVDLHGVTDRPTHRLAGKYNMITRLQSPPDDGINYIQVFRRQIGRRHALVEYRDLSFWVIDQHSLNGTFLNGERITRETRLKHGDRLRFHIYEFEFCVSDLALSNETLLEQERAAAR